MALKNYHIYLRLMIDGAVSKPFSAITLPPPKVVKSIKDEIIEFSRAKYGYGDVRLRTKPLCLEARRVEIS